MKLGTQQIVVEGEVMAHVWVVDSNCFIHIGSMAPEGFIDDLKKILQNESASLHVTPGVHDEVRNVRFQRWHGKPNLLDEMRDLLLTINVEEDEVRALAEKIGEKASPQDVDLSLMILAAKLVQEGREVTLVSDDFKMTTTGDKVNMTFETCPPSTFLQRLGDSGSKGQRTRLRSLSRRVRAAEMRYAISRAGQYDVQAKLTWMVDSLLASKLALNDESSDSSISDERKMVAALIRSIRGENVKKSTLKKLGTLPEICAPVSKLDEHLSSLSSDGSSNDIAQEYENTASALAEVLESTGFELAPLDEEMAELAHRAMAGYLYRIESALGVMAKMSGNLSLARLHLSRALHSATLIDDIGAEMRAMHQLGMLALATDDWKRAAVLFETSDRQCQTIGGNRIPHLVLSGISRQLNGDEELASTHMKSAATLVQLDKETATDILTSVGNGLLTVDCPGLAIEVLDEAMECAIESGQENRLEMLAELLLLANTAISNLEEGNYDDLRLLLDGLNDIDDASSEEFTARIANIDKKVDELSKPLDETWNEWQPATRLLPDGSPLTVLRIDEDEEGRNLVISHHSELGAIGLWLPEGGVQASPGNLIQIQDSRVKVAPPTEILRDIHNIRGVVAIENSDALSFIVRTDEILDDDDESELAA
jgi:rRNA maturation endonuclease Nob1